MTPPRGVTQDVKKIVAEFRKNTAETRSEGGSCDKRTAKKGHKVITLQRAMTRKGLQLFLGKKG